MVPQNLLGFFQSSVEAGGTLIGLLCWPGALFYVLYVHTFYVLGLPFNLLFLPYVLLVTLSDYTTIWPVASIDISCPRCRRLSSMPRICVVIRTRSASSSSRS